MAPCSYLAVDHNTPIIPRHPCGRLPTPNSVIVGRKEVVRVALPAEVRPQENEAGVETRNEGEGSYTEHADPTVSPEVLGTEEKHDRAEGKENDGRENGPRDLATDPAGNRRGVDALIVLLVTVPTRHPCACSRLDRGLDGRLESLDGSLDPRGRTFSFNLSLGYTKSGADAEKTTQTRI